MEGLSLASTWTPAGITRRRFLTVGAAALVASPCLLAPAAAHAQAGVLMGVAGRALMGFATSIVADVAREHIENWLNTLLDDHKTALGGVHHGLPNDYSDYGSSRVWAAQPQPPTWYSARSQPFSSSAANTWGPSYFWGVLTPDGQNAQVPFFNPNLYAGNYYYPRPFASASAAGQSDASAMLSIASTPLEAVGTQRVSLAASSSLPILNAQATAILDRAAADWYMYQMTDRTGVLGRDALMPLITEVDQDRFTPWWQDYSGPQVFRTAAGFVQMRYSASLNASGSIQVIDPRGRQVLFESRYNLL